LGRHRIQRSVFRLPFRKFNSLIKIEAELYTGKLNESFSLIRKPSHSIIFDLLVGNFLSDSQLREIGVESSYVLKEPSGRIASVSVSPGSNEHVGGSFPLT